MKLYVCVTLNIIFITTILSQAEFEYSNYYFSNISNCFDIKNDILDAQGGLASKKYYSKNNIESQGKIDSGKNVHFIAGNSIILNSGFTARNGASFLAQIDTNLVNVICDIDSNTYKSIIIGSQIWMAENLRTTKYRGGTALNKEANNSEEVGEWVNYNDDVKNDSIYGKLYNWYAVSGDSVCPFGWHIPSNNDWTILTNYLGGILSAGNKLKSIGTEYWYTSNSDVNNSSGFSGLPGGYSTGSNGGVYQNIRGYGYWWSSETHPTYENNAYYRSLFGNSPKFSKDFSNKNTGRSIRCLKD